MEIIADMVDAGASLRSVLPAVRSARAERSTRSARPLGTDPLDEPDQPDEPDVPARQASQDPPARHRRVRSNRPSRSSRPIALWRVGVGLVAGGLVGFAVLTVFGDASQQAWYLSHALGVALGTELLGLGMLLCVGAGSLHRPSHPAGPTRPAAGIVRGLILGAAIGMGFGAAQTATALVAGAPELDPLHAALLPFAQALWSAIIGGTLFGLISSAWSEPVRTIGSRLRAAIAGIATVLGLTLLHLGWNASAGIAADTIDLLGGLEVFGADPSGLIAVQWCCLALIGALSVCWLGGLVRTAERLARRDLADSVGPIELDDQCDSTDDDRDVERDVGQRVG